MINDVAEKLEKARELLSSGDFIRAFNFLRKLTSTVPDAGEIWLTFGKAIAGFGEMELADRAWAKAKGLCASNPELLLSLGHAYLAEFRDKEARGCFERAISLDSRNINSRISLAMVLERNHMFEEARCVIDECLKFFPDDPQALYFSAFLNYRKSKLQDAECQLRDLIASEPKHDYICYAARYNLAQILDQTQRYEEAMRFLGEAKKLVAAIVDPKILYAQYEFAMRDPHKNAKHFKKSVLRTWARSLRQNADVGLQRFAFLGGHPRSGTTLLEQILGANPGIAAIDEPMVVPAVLSEVSRQATEITSFPRNIARRRYLKHLKRELRGTEEKKLLLEKNPSSTLILPFLLYLFPDLPLIIAVRDPRDVLLSCYFQNIPLNNVNANFLSFERLARHYSDLMDVWLTVREWNDLVWIETRYENTIANVGDEGRRVTEFLGLEWHDNQRRYYNLKSSIISPTYHEVTQPIYSRSIGRWRNYEKYFEPILPVLDPYCRAFGYS